MLPEQDECPGTPRHWFGGEEPYDVPPPPPFAKRMTGWLPAPPPVCVVLASFAGLKYGPEYLDLKAGDVIYPVAPPEEIDPEGWAYGVLRRTWLPGWYPPTYVARRAVVEK